MSNISFFRPSPSLTIRWDNIKNTLLARDSDAGRKLVDDELKQLLAQILNDNKEKPHFSGQEIMDIISSQASFEPYRTSSVTRSSTSTALSTWDYGIYWIRRAYSQDTLEESDELER